MKTNLLVPPLQALFGKFRRAGSNSTWRGLLAAAFAALTWPVAGGEPIAPFTNSLGMRFVAVPGASELVSVWETRRRDFEAFVKATGYDATAEMQSYDGKVSQPRNKSWKDPGFEQTADHPVCGVSWHDANAFCRWLTEKERREGRIGPKQSYDLPSDRLWSHFAGLAPEIGGTPAQKKGKIADVYAWGTGWPPPRDAGNYGGTESGLLETLTDYGDDHVRTAPVGSYRANRFGLFDVGGNVSEWCEDWFDERQTARIQRGASWGNNKQRSLALSDRIAVPPAGRYDKFGFRCVLVTR